MVGITIIPTYNEDSCNKKYAHGFSSRLLFVEPRFMNCKKVKKKKDKKKESTRSP